MTDTTVDDRDGLRLADVPFQGRRLWLLLGALVGLVAVFSIVGLLVVGPLDGSVGEFDRELARSLGEMRTPDWNDSTSVGSSSADSIVKIPATVVLSALFVWRWRRWREAALLVGALVLESSAFVITSFIVGRSRPAIEQLDSIPPTGSFPSGHAAAAVAFYGALAIIVWWRTQNPVLRGLATAVAVLAPPIVAFSRIYRGMHFFSDVTFGIVLGALSLYVVHRLLVEPADP